MLGARVHVTVVELIGGGSREPVVEHLHSLDRVVARVVVPQVVVSILVIQGLQLRGLGLGLEKVRVRVRGCYVPTTVTRLVKCDNRV